MRRSLQLGFPIRHGLPGYNMPSHIRIGVRDPDSMNGWFQGLLDLGSPSPLITSAQIPIDLVLKHTTMCISDIHIHESVIMTRVVALEEYVRQSEVFVIPTVLISPEHVLIDGHHRLELFKRFGYTTIPVTVVDYHSPYIVTHVDVDRRIIAQFLVATMLSM